MGTKSDESKSRSSFEDFIQSAKSSIRAVDQLPIPNKLKIVLGNESCDLDSAACTLACAILLQSLTTNNTDLILPVFNILKKDIFLKTEVMHLLNKFNISPDQLIFRNEIQTHLLKYASAGQLEVTLLDHHIDTELHDYVVEIIDHRPKEKDCPSTAVVTIEPVGSCASLILKKIINSQCDNFISKFPEAVEFLYGAILLDTNNLSVVTQRFKQLDLDMVIHIEPFVLQANGGTYSRTQYFDELLTARCNVNSMTPLEMLGKDAKKAYSLPVCGLTMLVQKYCAMDGAEDALKTYCSENDTNAIVIMGLSIDKENISRDLGFYSRTLETETKITHIAECLLKASEPSLLLEIYSTPDRTIQGLTIYNQRNLMMTRKHVLPLIKSAVGPTNDL